MSDKPSRARDKKLPPVHDFPYDPTPMVRDFPPEPQSCLDAVNQYGTYEIQPTQDAESFFPAIAQGLPKGAQVCIGRNELEKMSES